MMNRTDVENYLFNNLETYTGEYEFEYNTKFSDLNIDSLDGIEIVMMAEEEFDIKLRDDELDELKTVGDAIDLICNVLGDKDQENSVVKNHPIDWAKPIQTPSGLKCNFIKKFNAENQFSYLVEVIFENGKEYIIFCDENGYFDHVKKVENVPETIFTYLNIFYNKSTKLAFTTSHTSAESAEEKKKLYANGGHIRFVGTTKIEVKEGQQTIFVDT